MGVVLFNTVCILLDMFEPDNVKLAGTYICFIHMKALTDESPPDSPTLFIMNTLLDFISNANILCTIIFAVEMLLKLAG